MSRSSEPKTILVVRSTRLAELKSRFATTAQAKFYVTRLGGDFDDYDREDATYRNAIARTTEILTKLGRLQIVDRNFLPNFVFGPEDVVIALGQDGLVANTLKYLDGQPLIGVNPDPKRWDGKLLPFKVNEVERVIRGILRESYHTTEVTLAEAKLNTGLSLCAVNDLFIGVKSHSSARYRIAIGGDAENHSSSGIIVSTGLGSSGWFKSLVSGANAIASSRSRDSQQRPATEFPWDSNYLYFTVREPFPSKTTGTSLVFGKIDPTAPLTIESRMAENGVIFSDGIEQDFLEFNSGTQATINLAQHKGRLVV